MTPTQNKGMARWKPGLERISPLILAKAHAEVECADWNKLEKPGKEHFLKRAELTLKVLGVYERLKWGGKSG